MQGTFWALVPAFVAIILALITKEVYSSLFIGIFMGALFFTGFNPISAFEFFINGQYVVEGETQTAGLVSVLSDSYNVGIIIFLVVLGAMVSLLNKSGGSKAFGEWASNNRWGTSDGNSANPGSNLYGTGTTDADLDGESLSITLTAGTYDFYANDISPWYDDKPLRFMFIKR